MGYKSYYTFRTMTGVPNVYHAIKFDRDLEHEDTYALSTHNGSPSICSCFAGNKWCRHKQMFQLFQEAQRINTGWFYQYDTKTWVPPIDPEGINNTDEVKTPDDSININTNTNTNPSD